MHPSHCACVQQQRRVRHQAANTDTYAFFNLLTGPRLFEQVESLLPEHRERLFAPTETLSMFLAQTLSADRSCQQAVNDAAVKRLVGGLPRCSTHTGAYCKARQRLPLQMVTRLCRHTGRLIAEGAPAMWHWQGRPVRLVDGATVVLPDTPENQAAYPQPASQKAGLGFPQCRLVALLCLGSGGCSMWPLARAKAREAMNRLCCAPSSIPCAPVTSSWGMPSTRPISCSPSWCNGAWTEYSNSTGHGDAASTSLWARSSASATTSSCCTSPRSPTGCARPTTASPREPAGARATHRPQDPGHQLCCPRHTPKPALKTLYRRRWHVELDLRHIKTTLGMEMLSCKTPEMAIKEVWVHLLAYNLIRLLMAQAAWLADQTPRQLSFKHTVQIWTVWQQRGGAQDPVTLSALLVMIAEQRVGKRPRRVEPRAVKRRPKPFPLLCKPRQLVREEIRENGHPKKVK